MIEIRRSNERGRANHGWLDSHHTFSFASYSDPRHMGFGDLRVINEDRVDAGAGFPTHPHQDMEIVSYVVDGGLAHRDTLGTGSIIRPGEVQLMSAGRGIAHSEMNASRDEGVHFLQIWLLPDETQRGAEPRYFQKDFGETEGLLLVVSPDGRDGSLEIRQDVDLYRARLPAGTAIEHAVQRGRVWVQVVRGVLSVNGERLHPGDGAAITETEAIALRADEDVEALLFDLH